MFGEDDRLHIGRVHDAVDDDEGGVGIIGGHDFEGGGLAEARHDDGVGARFGEAAHGLFALRVVLKLDLAVGAAGFLGPTLSTVEGGFVE